MPFSICSGGMLRPLPPRLRFGVVAGLRGFRAGLARGGPPLSSSLIDRCAARIQAVEVRPPNIKQPVVKALCDKIALIVGLVPVG